MRSTRAAGAEADLRPLRNVLFGRRAGAGAVPSKQTNAKLSASKRLKATSEIWYPVREEPIEDSVFMVGGKPTRPAENKDARSSRTVVLRRAVGAHWTDVA